MEACFINFQYGDHGEELRQLEESTGVHIYDWEDADPLADLRNQAAQMAERDLVISFDYTTGKITGAIGKEIWGLVPALILIGCICWTGMILFGSRPPNYLGKQRLRVGWVDK